jgi:predicted permease
MNIFTSTLNQMGVLGLFMVIGFIVKKLKAVPDNASAVLSKLENTVFLPALVLGTFIENFRVSTLAEAWQPLVLSLVLELIIIPVGIISARLANKDGFIRKMYTYGLCFANFGFMGNAVVQALFSAQLYQTYIIFTLPLWTLIYVWAVPGLLIDKDESNIQTKKDKIVASLKAIANPMFIALLIGAIIGITGLGEVLSKPLMDTEYVVSSSGISVAKSAVPLFIMNVINVCGACMSPVAMMLTGITFASIDIKKVLSDISIYVVTFLRLIVYPLVFGGIVWLLRTYVGFIGNFFTQELFICFVCTLSMPLGLNTVVVPAGYGKDVSIPAGMALVSHLLSILTIPLMFTIFGLA